MNRLLYIGILSIILSAFSKCTTMRKEHGAIIEGAILLERLPSGSGIALWKDSLYIVSDDAPLIYQLSLKDNRYNEFTLKGYSNVDYRIPKRIKPDFEGMAVGAMNGNDYLFAFGSGSKSPGRDSLLILDLADLNNQQTINLTAFYKYLQQQTATTAAQWNVEGVALTNDTLLLFNRGNNLCIEIAWKKFVNYINGQLPFPPIAYYTLNLPKHNGHLARISGACELNKEGDILFCASIEDTPNWYTDGPVIGSYIGVYNRKTRALTKAELLTTSSGKPVKEKIESLDLLKVDTDGKIHIIAVSDNDLGNTNLLRIVLG